MLDGSRRQYLSVYPCVALLSAINTVLRQNERSLGLADEEQAE